MFARVVFIFLCVASPTIFARILTEQEQTCGAEEWQCKDGSCIKIGDKCNGAVDCPDRSDETKNTCWDKEWFHQYMRKYPITAVKLNTLARIVTEQEQTCGCTPKQFRCQYGGCVEQSADCDGVVDCADSSDEVMARCYNQTFYEHEVLFDMDAANPRLKRYADYCSNVLTAPPAIDFCKRRFKCQDGTWISSYDKCDGVRHCPDGSDETFVLCRHQKCQPNWFRCVYGACVDGSAPCNKKQDCADNSDELLPRCRHEREVTQNFKCDDGSSIPAQFHCDGQPHCGDGSDETLRACAGKRCSPYLFQCAYGACVDQGSDCDNKSDCADNSDELQELCNNTMTVVTAPPPPPKDEPCVLPPQPKHGSYIVENMAAVQPGQTFKSVVLGITCQAPYGVNGLNWTICDRGHWYPTADIENICVLLCKLPSRESAIYRCLATTGPGTRDCEDFEPLNTVVVPVCKPNYHHGIGYNDMVCLETGWSVENPCEPVTAGGVPGGSVVPTTAVPVYDIDIRNDDVNKVNARVSANNAKANKSVDKVAKFKRPVTSRM